jgi:hypothetical protein
MKLWQRLLGWKPVKIELPDPFDADLEDAYLDGPSALRAETPVRYKFNTPEWKAWREKQKKRHNPDLLPAAKEPVPEDDPSLKQYYEKPKRGRPFSEWQDGRDYWTSRMYMSPRDGNLDKDGKVFSDLVAVDTHTEVSYAYCQKGHLHAYNNGKLVVKHRWGGTLSSKHYPETPYLEDSSDALGWADKTIRETPYCD